MVSCHSGNKKVLDNRVTLNRLHKIPYGTWYAYENLQHIFPIADISVNKSSPNYTGSKTEAFVAICRTMAPSEEEAAKLSNFITNGGHVFLSAYNFNKHILDSLHLEMAYDFFTNAKGLTVDDPVTSKADSFYYPGQPLDNYFSKIDSNITFVLGRNANGRPNFVKFTYNNGGALYLHCEPTALTNFFLLHKDNKKYYDEVMSQLPQNITSLYWDEYFRTHRMNNGDSDFSALRWIKKQPGLAAAMWMLLLLALLVYLFESKRKQRVVPIRPPLKNASVEFARTVGRLYLQRKDNNNLAYKMAAIFMDHVRRKFNVRTTMDDEFIEKLSHKSGYDKESLAKLVYQLKYAQAHFGVTDLELLELQQMLDHFYQHT
jgi:hypothetical protein